MNLKSILPHAWRQSLKRRLFTVQDMHARLTTLRRAGFAPTAAIDGGAYHGDWTRELWRTWPRTPVLLVEPQGQCREALQQLASAVPGSQVVSAALSDTSGRATLRLSESNSGLVAQSEPDATTTEVDKQTIAGLLDARPGLTPNLLKLDLQGHELRALEGAGPRLAQFEVIILEVSVLRIGEVPIFHEVDAWMEARGLRLYDLIPQYYRPLDGALWQVDAFYVQRHSALVASRSWG